MPIATNVTLSEYPANDRYLNYRAVRGGLIYEGIFWKEGRTNPCELKALVRDRLQWENPVGFVDDDDYLDEDYDDTYCDCGCMDDDDDDDEEY